MNGKEYQKRIKMSGIPQKDLAERMGVHPTQFTSWFKQGSISSEIIEKTAKLLGMSIGQFYGEKDDTFDRNKMLREISTKAMQGFLIQNPNFSDDILETKTYEQCIAELSVRQAMYMLEQFKKEGIDK